MPFVIALSGGNLLSETGSLNKSVQALQAARDGAILDQSATAFSPSTVPLAWTQPPGWPSISGELNFESCLYYIGCRGTNMGDPINGAWCVQLGLGIDGATPTAIQSVGTAPIGSADAPPTTEFSIGWSNVIQGILPGTHTYTLYVQVTGSGTPSPAINLTSPYILLYPL